MVWLTIDVSPNDSRLDLSESRVRAYDERTEDDRGSIHRLYDIEEIVVVWDGIEVDAYDEDKIIDLLINQEAEREEWKL